MDRVQVETIVVTDDRVGQLTVAAADVAGGVPLLVHAGSPGSRVLYGPQVELAAEHGFRLLSYDRPGFGESPPRPGRRVAEAVGEARAIADALGFPSFATWGYSGGGPFALACAALLPERVSAACVIGSLGPYGAPGLDFAAGMSVDHQQDVELFFTDRAQARENFRAEALEMLAASSDPATWMMRWGDRAGTDAAHSQALADHLAALVRESARQGDEGWWDDWVAYLTPWGFDVREIRRPVQLWHGAQDAAAPVAHGRWLAERIPGVEAHILADDDHVSIEINHQREALEWLRRRAA